MASVNFERLIRFVSTSGKIHFGEVPRDHPWDKDLVGIQVALYDGQSPWDENLKLNGQTAEVKDVLSPLADVPFIYGIGLNYRRHAEESGVGNPWFPTEAAFYLQPATLCRSRFHGTREHLSNIPVSACTLWISSVIETDSSKMH